MKKIRKTYSGVVPNGKVLNSRNDSLQDTYSSDYLNRAIPNTNDLGEIVVDDIICKNLLPNNIQSKTVQGVTATKNKDGSITFNGTATNGTASFSFDISLNLKAGTYTHSISNSAPSGLYISLDNKNETMIGQVGSEKQVTFTLSEDKTYSEYIIWIPTGMTFDNYTIYPQIEPGSVATGYVEHKEFGKVKGNGVSTSSSFGNSTISTNSTTLANMGLKPTTLTVNNDNSTVIIFAKVGGLYNSSNSYGIVFDVNMDKTTFSSSGSKQIASANLRGNWSTDGTLKCEFIDMFIFKNVPKGEHNFYMYWATNDSSATAYSGYYAGISMTAIEL